MAAQLAKEEKTMQHMATKMAQWKAIMAAGMADVIPAAAVAPVSGRKARRPLHICKHCKKEGYSEDDGCFSLEKEKDKRPKWYDAG